MIFAQCQACIHIGMLLTPSSLCMERCLQWLDHVCQRISSVWKDETWHMDQIPGEIFIIWVEGTLFVQGRVVWCQGGISQVSPFGKNLCVANNQLMGRTYTCHCGRIPAREAHIYSSFSLSNGHWVMASLLSFQDCSPVEAREAKVDLLSLWDNCDHFQQLTNRTERLCVFVCVCMEWVECVLVIFCRNARIILAKE